MAAPSSTTWGAVVGDYGKIGIYTNLSSSETESTLTVEVWFWSKFSVSDLNNTLYYDNLSTASSATTDRGSVSIKTYSDTGGWSTSNQQKIASYSYTYNHGTAQVTRYLRARLHNVDRVGSDMYVYDYVKIPALSSYKIVYDANGGSGGPGTQTKRHGVALAISSIKPTRTGYTFQGWTYNSNSTVALLKEGDYLTTDASVTLYAVWTANTYIIKYDANRGTGAPGNQTKTYGKTLTLSSVKPTRTNYNFKGWGVSASSTTVSYAPGASYTNNAAVTLYAVWELAYVKPRITNLSVIRCDSSGTASEEGQNGFVSFDWECDKTVSSIVIKWKLPSDTSWTSVTVASSGTSGTVNRVIGDDSLSVENSYDVYVSVADANGSMYATETLPSMKITIDLLAGGNGVAFGKTAEIADTVEFEFDAKFNGPVYGKALGMDRLPSIPSGSDFNDYMEPGCYAVTSNTIAASCVNIPIDRAGRLEVWSSTGEGVRSEQWSYLRQRYIPYNSSNAVLERDVTRGSDNVWNYGDWWRSSLTPTASEKIYHEQKILWGGDKTSGWHMNKSQTATLSEAISAQANGIVLVFCYYNGTSDTNYNFLSFFIPKIHNTIHASMEHTFILSTSSFNYIGVKYLYISDTAISGHESNNATGTTNGITFANNKFVLRYVIGV